MTTDGQAQELRALLRERFPRERTHLLPALHLVQHQYGHLPEWALRAVSQHLRVPPSEVYGAATSYVELRLKAPAQHTLCVCTGLSCWLNGAREVLDAAKESLGILPGKETSADGSVTLEETPCGFLCPTAPVVQWDGAWRGQVTPRDIQRTLREASS